MSKAGKRIGPAFNICFHAELQTDLERVGDPSVKSAYLVKLAFGVEKQQESLSVRSY